MPALGGEGITEPGQFTSRVLDRFTAHLLKHGGKRGRVDDVDARAQAGDGVAAGVQRGLVGDGLVPRESPPTTRTSCVARSWARRSATALP